MTRQLLTSTTAIALVLSLSAPAAVLPATAGPTEMRLAQAEGGENRAQASPSEDAAKEELEEAAAAAAASGDAPGQETTTEEAEGAADAEERADEGSEGEPEPRAEPTADAQAGDEREAEEGVSEAQAEAASEAQPETDEAATAETETEEKAEEPASGEAADAESGKEPEAQADATPDAEAGDEPETAESETAESETGERVSGEQAEDPAGAEAASEEAAATEAEAEAEAEAEEATATEAEAEAEERVSEEQAEEAVEAEAAGTETAPEEAAATEAEAEAEAQEAAGEAAGEAATAETQAEAEEQPVETSETAKEPTVEEPQAAAAADSGDAAEPVEVISETVTEETTRSSNEEVQAFAPDDRDEGGDSSNLLGILGAAGAGLAAGALLSGGGEVVENTGDRVIIERNGEYFVRKDENELLRRPGSQVSTSTYSDGSTRTVVERDDGVRVVTIRDSQGYVVRRSRLMPDGREIVLIDDTRQARASSTRIDWEPLPPMDYSVPHDRYVDYGSADREALRDTLEAGPAVDLDRSFTLRQVRETRELRDLMPRLDLDVITFDLGSAAIRPEQARKLDELGRAMEDILDRDPAEVFLIEGHTDAVGGRAMNLALSDRRAESVALALTENYDIPPENLITQGYGEEYLKIESQGAERANRRATVRRITPLLEERTAAQ